MFTFLFYTLCIIIHIHFCICIYNNCAISIYTWSSYTCVVDVVFGETFVMQVTDYGFSHALIFYKNIKHTSPYGAYVIHQVSLVGFAYESPQTEQTDAQKSEFTDSTGLLDNLFSAFPSLRGIVINDLRMKVLKDYWPPKTWARARTLKCFFSLVNYFLPIRRLIISEFFHSN